MAVSYKPAETQNVIPYLVVPDPEKELAFVKEVATRHGGDVSVQSVVGKGSVFTLEIPGLS